MRSPWPTGSCRAKNKQQLIYNTWKSTNHSSFFCQLQTVMYIPITSPKVRFRSMDVKFKYYKGLVHKHVYEILPYQKTQRAQLTSRIWQKRETIPPAVCYWRRNYTATSTAHSLMTTVNYAPNASSYRQYGMPQTSVPRRNITYKHDNRQHTVPQAICKRKWHDEYVLPVWIKPLKGQWSLYVPPGLTFTNSTFCPTVYLCVLCGSENKQRLFPYTALTDWFL